ncbi:unnamed protein product [Ixodes hexagonus]
MKTDGGGWTVIQKRMPTSTFGKLENTDFEQSYETYKKGFRNEPRGFWLGESLLDCRIKYNVVIFLCLICVHRIVFCRPAPSILSSIGHVRCDGGKHSGSLSYDALNSSNGAPFSTYTSTGQQKHGDKCTEQRSGGWWFSDCTQSNLNGRSFTKIKPTANGLGITWYNKNDRDSYRQLFDEVEMKIRDASSVFCKIFHK